MDEKEVVELMASSNTALEWRQNADKVKNAFAGDYPGFWWNAIMASGVATRTMAKWRESPALRVFGFYTDTANGETQPRWHECTLEQKDYDNTK